MSNIVKLETLNFPLSFLFATVKGACSHPIAAKREAAQAVYAVMKPYTGVQSLPQRQQVQTVDGLVLDLEKEATAAHLATLGLTSEVETLKTLNAEYGSLIASRADSQQANPVESAKPIRKVFGEQADCRHEYGVQPADGAAEEGRGGDGISRLAVSIKKSSGLLQIGVFFVRRYLKTAQHLRGCLKMRIEYQKVMSS